MKDLDMTVWDGAIAALEKPGDGWINVDMEDTASLLLDKRVKDLYLNYMKGLRESAYRGEFIAGAFTTVPLEIFRAMDMPTVQIINMCCLTSLATGIAQECQNIAGDLGIMFETCGVHRVIASHFSKGWVPGVKVMIRALVGCDSASNSGGISSDYYGIPEFGLDAPYYYNERSVKYYASELESLIKFLEDLSGKKMDWDRLKEIVKLTGVMRKLTREIAELRKTIPSPMENRRAWQLNWLSWVYAGTQEGIDWLTAVRDDLKRRVAEKKGVAKEEKFRLMDLFMVPMHCNLRILNWMQEQGVVMVNEALIFTWGKEDVEMDPSQPLISLAHKLYNGPLLGTLMGPIENGIEYLVRDAKDYNIDGAVFWQTNACRQSGLIQSWKEALSKKAGVPTAVIEMDLIDTTIATYEQIKEKLEEFFETLESIREEA
ncbi:MAG TPA: 2-hydroxyacyl-CoA dehydratase family protein [Syntrophales bacterium]|nr:2-hydroxyacyl-CoA dehydratase family protein [Syntrophales bacterium]